MPPARTSPRLIVRIKLGDGSIMGPGKADLLEQIETTGSISAAARAMGMSYRQAWMLVDTLNAAFGRAVIETSQGGRAGGGAHLSPLGQRILSSYRALQVKAAASTRNDLRTIGKLMASSEGPAPRRRGHPVRREPR